MEREHIKNKNIWLYVALVTLLFWAFWSSSFFTGTKTYIAADREVAPLQQSVDEASLVAEVEINNAVEEINAGGLPQTIFSATITDLLKGKAEENINIIQDGTASEQMLDTPLFKSGEKYILTLKRAKGENINAYWITKEYYINGNQAIDVFPCEKTDTASAGIRTYAADQYNSGIERESGKFKHEVLVMNKSDLKATIEGGAVNE